VAISYPFVYEDTQIQQKVVKTSKGPGSKHLTMRKGEGAETMDDCKKSVIVLYRKTF
jgi:hypothetical protein